MLEGYETRETNSHTLLVGVQIVMTTTENSLLLSIKIKHMYMTLLDIS